MRWFAVSLISLIGVGSTGCIAALALGSSTIIGSIGIGQRVIDHQINKEKNERLKALEVGIQQLCEVVRAQGKPDAPGCEKLDKLKKIDEENRTIKK